MKQFADERRIMQPTFDVGDRVMLRREEIPTNRPSSKLDYKFLGPYSITKLINPVAFELDLPSNSRLHRVFHVSLLEPYRENVIPGRIQPPPEPILVADDDHPLYIVDQILDSKYKRGKLHYFLSWEGYPPSDRTWEPAHQLGGTGGLDKAIAEYHQEHPDRPGPQLRQHRAPNR